MRYKMNHDFLIFLKNGYIGNRLKNFRNTVNFPFDENKQIKCAYCDQISIVICSWYKKPLCFKQFLMKTITATNISLNVPYPHIVIWKHFKINFCAICFNAQCSKWCLWNTEIRKKQRDDRILDLLNFL